MAGGSLTQEVRGWRLIGACVWHLAACCLGLWCWAVLRSLITFLPWRPFRFFISPAKGFLLLVSAAPQLLSLIFGSAVMIVHEPAPLYSPRFSIKLPLHLSIWLAKAGARLASISGLAKTGVMLAAQAAGAATFFASDYRLMNGRFQSAAEVGWSLFYGVVLSCTYILHLYCTSRDVLRFPPIQRHRYFRIRQSVPEAVRTAGVVSGMAIAVQLLCCVLLPRQLGAALRVSNLWTAGLGSIGLVYCWAIGRSVLHVYFTERLDFGKWDDDPPALLVHWVKQTKEPLLGSLALLDLAMVAEAPPHDNAQRLAIFEDESGGPWQALGGACVAQVEDAIAAAAGALTPQAAARAQGGEGGGGGRGGGGGGGTRQQANGGSHTPPARWNVLPHGIKSVGGPISPQQAAAMWRLRSQAADTRWAVRSLGALAAASSSEDRVGVLQLTRPSLGDVTVSLGSLLLALQQYLRHSYSLPVRQLALGTGAAVPERELLTGTLSSQGVDPVAFELQDAAQAAMYSICTTFGPAIKTAVREAASGSKPPHGSPADVAALVARFVAFQE